MWPVKNLSRLLTGCLALLVLTGVTVWSLVAVLPPAARSNQPVTEFGSDRAFAHVQTIGRDVHVAGSDAAHQVRDYIAGTLTGMGVQPTITDGVGADDALGSLFAMAHVNNVVARIPGTDSTGTIFLFAHYDSVQISHGANDDGAGVSTLLETVRALKAGPTLRNDMVFLFTDAEEACLCGAEHFVSAESAGGRRRGGAELRVPRHQRPGDHVRDRRRQRRCGRRLRRRGARIRWRPASRSRSTGS